MLADNDRLLGTVEQVLQASRAKEKQRSMNLAEIDLRRVARRDDQDRSHPQHFERSNDQICDAG